jgi:hypothetical protein
VIIYNAEMLRESQQQYYYREIGFSAQFFSVQPFVIPHGSLLIYVSGCLTPGRSEKWFSMPGGFVRHGHYLHRPAVTIEHGPLPAPLSGRLPPEHAPAADEGIIILIFIGPGSGSPGSSWDLNGRR